MTAATAKRETWNQVKWHPHAEKYPLLTGKKFEELCERILANGQRETIKFRLVKGEKEYLDGRNRWRACDWLGIEPKFERVFGLDTEEKVVEYIDDENDYRRHLTVEEQAAVREQRIERVAEARTEGKSLRAIAEQEGVSESQVRRDLEEASTAPGGAVTPAGGKVTGKDGRQQPATRPQSRAERVGQVPPKPFAVREPGDDSDAEAADHQANGAARRKTGKATFKVKELEDAYGGVVRALAKARDAWGASKDHAACHDRLVAFFVAWEHWKGSIR